MDLEDDQKYRELIPEIRKRVEGLYAKQPELYDECDIVSGNTVDWNVFRFIKWNKGDVDKTMEHLDDALKWRKSFGINWRLDSDTPNEFVKCGAVFPFGTDSDGRTVIYLRVKVYKKIPELKEYFLQFLAGVVNKVDMESGETGYVILFDLTGFGISNVDMDFLRDLIDLWRKYNPLGVRYVIVNNLPKVLKPLWQVVKLWVPHADMIRFANGDEIQKFIPPKQLLLYLGGEAYFDFTLPPPSAKPVSELAKKYGFSDKDVAKYMKIFEPQMEEAQLLINGKTKKDKEKAK